jgi:hypothetical protein
MARKLGTLKCFCNYRSRSRPSTCTRFVLNIKAAAGTLMQHEMFMCVCAVCVIPSADSERGAFAVTTTPVCLPSSDVIN